MGRETCRWRTTVVACVDCISYVWRRGQGSRCDFRVRRHCRYTSNDNLVLSLVLLRMLEDNVGLTAQDASFTTSFVGLLHEHCLPVSKAGEADARAR